MSTDILEPLHPINALIAIREVRDALGLPLSAAPYDIVQKARQLTRFEADARPLLDRVAALPTHQDCPPENHGLVVDATTLLSNR